MIENTDFIFNPFTSMKFTYEECFLCGVKLTLENETEEHIFPKWLQHRFNLWNQTVSLLNGTRIPYRMLKIPCCSICNGIHLSNLENIIRNGVESGFDEFIKIDKLFIFQWIVKIFYGLLFKELSLNIDRGDSSKGTITTPELLDSYSMTHTFLQSVRTPVEFYDFVPWSIFILKGQIYNDNRDFHYIDGLKTLTFSIKLGEIIIIANLQDNGIHQEQVDDYFKRLDNKSLHNIQFIELAAKNVYSSHLLNFRPFYMLTKSFEDQTLKVFSLKHSYSWDDWNNYHYANVLYHYLVHTYDYFKFDDLYAVDDNLGDAVATTLFNEKGDFEVLPPDVKVVFKKIK
ncbi:hypothetical protein [Neobacillus sp. YIM B06451]|uniref:hypothetical protein n=1 Tax=Neobacillus sp. YIM B06451 TaxID=3070994 RepID=UPI00292D71D1|nr:hypothetical protein [Neobacillus sp. YIM B06451]